MLLIMKKNVSPYIRTYLMKSRTISSTGRMFTNVKDPTGKNVVLVDGVRIPFRTAFGDYTHSRIHTLQTIPFMGLVRKTGIDRDIIQYVICGNVQGDPRVYNLAKTAAVFSGFNDKTPCHSVSMVCISSMQSITSAMGLIACDSYDVIVAGGVDKCENTVQFDQELRVLMVKIIEAKNLEQRLRPITKLKLKHLKLDYPELADFITKEQLGHSADRMAASFNVSRMEQDEYALKSHNSAIQAREAGYLTDIIPAKLEGNDAVFEADENMRKSTLQQLSRLKPAFIKPHGTVTAANSCPRSDGASACLISTEAKAKHLGLKPKAYLRQFIYTSQDCVDQQLFGPAYSISLLLKKVGLTVDDIDVWEVHEAFAAQVLANLKAMDSDSFCQNYIGLQSKVGVPDMDKFNTWGGSLAIGHPFGATSIRLVMHAANRLVREDGRLAVVAACANGGLGQAIILERHPDAHFN